MSCAVFYLNRVCVVLIHHSTSYAPCFNVNVKNLALDITIITNARFSMKNNHYLYSCC